MREIRFRGKLLNNREWVYGDYHRRAGNVHTIIEMKPDKYGKVFYEVSQIDPNTLGQFTGLLDKNGTEIYEEDIIALGHKRNCKASVVWIDAGFARKSANPLDDAYYLTGADMERYEVIGNIHDNPELLK